MEEIDLVFALHGSKDLKRNGFEKVKTLVKNIIDNYHISEPGTHVAVLEYSDRPVIQFRLDEKYSAKAIKNLISKITPSGGNAVVTSEAIKKAGKELFGFSNGGRPTASKVLVIVTDGSSTSKEPLEEAIKPLKKAGVDTFVVSIGGKPSPDEVEKITGTDNIIKTEDKDNIPEAATTIVIKINKRVNASMSLGLFCCCLCRRYCYCYCYCC